MHRPITCLPYNVSFINTGEWGPLEQRWRKDWQGLGGCSVSGDLGGSLIQTQKRITGCSEAVCPEAVDSDKLRFIFRFCF